MADPRWLDEGESRAWRSYKRMSSQLDALLSRGIQRDAGMSLPDYEVLVLLSEAPEGRLRLFELGAALLWEKSRLSHHLRRMEARGLVERITCESDGRGLWAVLTPEGRAAIERAAPHHVRHVREFLIDHLDPADLDRLAEITEKVNAALPPREETACLAEDGVAGAP